MASKWDSTNLLDGGECNMTESETQVGGLQGPRSNPVPHPTAEPSPGFPLVVVRCLTPGCPEEGRAKRGNIDPALLSFIACGNCGGAVQQTADDPA